MLRPGRCMLSKTTIGPAPYHALVRRLFGQSRPW